MPHKVHKSVADVHDDDEYQRRIEFLRSIDDGFEIMRVNRHDEGATHVVLRKHEDDSLAALVIAPGSVTRAYNVYAIMSQAAEEYVKGGTPEFVKFFPIDNDDERRYKRQLRLVRKELSNAKA
jgi:hypothetical protein